MATIHFIQQGKGGVGKSMIASILYQYLKNEGVEVIAIDTDPINATLSGYKEFQTTRLEIMEGDNIDQRKFDGLMEILFALDERSHAIIDNGASSFIALTSYIKSNDAVEILKEHGRIVYFHTVITGGQAILDTVSGLKTLCMAITEAPIVVWLNSFFGKIAMDGKGFEDFKVYKDHHQQFSAIIKIPQGQATTTGKDLEEMYAKRQSFESCINSSAPIMVRSRLKKYWGELCGLLKQAPFSM